MARLSGNLLRVSAVQAIASQMVAASLHEGLTLKDVAAYLARTEAVNNAGTLELAFLLRPAMRIRETTLMTGDRILLEMKRPQPLPSPTNFVEPQLRFRGGTYETISGSRTGLLVGVANADMEAVPDIDLRYFVSPSAVDFLSRGCVWMQYVPQEQRWYASKIGQTRIMLDEYELHTEKLPVDRSLTLRLFPPHGSFLPSHRPLGELHIDIVKDPARPQNTLPTGSARTRIVLGVEKLLGTLNLSDSLTVETVRDQLSAHFHTSPSGVNVYGLRLLPPQTTLAALIAERESFLYMSRDPGFVQSVLRLRDYNGGPENHQLVAANRNETKTLGCRSAKDALNPALDIDLYHRLLASFPHLPAQIPLGSVWAYFSYRAEEKQWWLHPGDQPMPLFVNNRRLPASGIRLVNDDVLSIGFEASDVIFRYITTLRTEI